MKCLEKEGRGRREKTQRKSLLLKEIEKFHSLQEP